MHNKTGNSIKLIPPNWDIVSQRQVFRTISFLASLRFPAFYREFQWVFDHGLEAVILSGERVIPLDKSVVTYFTYPKRYRIISECGIEVV